MPNGILDKLIAFFGESPNTPGHTFGQAETRFAKRPVQFRPDLGGDLYGRYYPGVADNPLAEFFLYPTQIATREPRSNTPRTIEGLNRTLFHEDIHSLVDDPGVLEFLMRQSPDIFKLKSMDGSRADIIPRRREDQEHQLIDTILDDFVHTSNTPADEALLDEMFGLMSPRRQDNEVLRKLQMIRDRRP